MTGAQALLDSNVLIAAIAPLHVHHSASVTVLGSNARGTYAVAAHSWCEAYSNLTRRSQRSPYQLSSAAARRALDNIAEGTVLVGLTPGQTLNVVRDYADEGGIGARLYDRLIGEAAVMAGLRRIVTWNVGHMRGLFPDLEVLTPDDVLADSGRSG